MLLSLSNKETKEKIEEFEAADWVEAVKHVERQKKELLEKGHKHLAILNTAKPAVCYWTLEEAERPILLADKLHKSQKP